MKILKNIQSENEPELFIFEETLKVKGITYKIYGHFEDLADEMDNVETQLMVSDYIFQN